MSKHSRIHARDDSTTQLLPSNSGFQQYSDDKAPQFRVRLLPARPSSCRHWMPFFGAVALVVMLSFASYIAPHHKTHLSATEETALETQPAAKLTQIIPPVNETAATQSPQEVAEERIRMLFARQSHTLEEATTSYTLKSGRSPPPGFDRWFKYAKENQCLVDEYDRVHRDFAPFYEIASEHPAHFQQMVDQGREMMARESRGMTTIRIRHGEVQFPEHAGTSFDADLHMIIQNFTPILPEMEFMLNGRDEPRVVFNTHAPDAQVDAMHLRDPNPFLIEPVPTSGFFKKQSGCDVLDTPSGFVADPIHDVSFLRSSSTSGFTVDLWPLLSMTKISPCFSDILFPGVYYYDKSWWSGGFMHPNDIPWADKQDKLYWRGMSNGGHIHGQNFRSFPRFRLIDIARNHSDLIDARMTVFTETHCTTDDCDREGIIAEYNITGPPAPKEEVYGFKYLFDVDGNTFSGRYLGLLRSGGLVFKSTAFEEYFSDWLHPYVHYIPVRPDLSDLVDKIEWARTHEREARIIQETGRLFAQAVLTDAQNDCYFSAVLLEWARLQSFAAVLGNGTDVNATAAV